MKIATLAAGALLLATAPAVAQPPPQGWVGAFPQPSILCDTSAQLKSIVDAFGRDAAAGKARLKELFTLMNNRHEPTCAVVAVQGAMTADSMGLGRVKIEGEDVYGWIIHLSSSMADGYYLYLESPSEALKNTI